MQARLAVQEFASEIYTWYVEYTKSPYFTDYKKLEGELSQKASNIGYLDGNDLMAVAIWGGDEERHQLGTNICGMNTPEEIEQHTREAIEHIHSPEDALESLLCIRYVGLAYASKTLRCVCPQSYGALDIHTRRACAGLELNIDDGDRQSVVAGYLWFLEICSRIQGQVSATGPRPGGLWFIADIEMALFQFAYPPVRGKLA